MSKSEDRQKKAQEAKARAAAAQAKERRIRLIGTSAVVLVVVGVLGIGIIGSRGTDAPADSGTVPSMVDQTNGSYTYNPDTTASATLELWEDFQCPGCGNFESIFSESTRKLADEGVVKLIIHPAAFLDAKLGNNFSTKATSAWGCALNAGPEYGWKVRELIFANQPTNEGTGWTDAQFRAFGADAGIEGEALATYETCVDTMAHAKWAAVGTEHFREKGIQSTPTVWLNGEDVPEDALNGGPEVFEKWIRDNATN